MRRPSRISLPARDVPELHAWLDARLSGAMLATQPDVAGRVLELLEDHGTGIKELSEAIRTDPILSGRVLRLANSALFAQRQHVADIEHACLLLGTDRLRQVALGFRVASEAQSLDASFPRRVWTLCLERAFLARELAAVVAPALAPPAFVVGLIIDAGLSVMPELIGPEYETRIGLDKRPEVLFQAEAESLPFTHVDLAQVLSQRWRLPEILRRPIAWHHTRPAGRRRTDAEAMLHRVAYCVGQIRRPLKSADQPELEQLASRIIGITPDAVRDAGARAEAELGAVRGMLDDVAARLGDLAEINRIVHTKLVEAHGDEVVRSLMAEFSGSSGVFIIAGRRITLEPDPSARAEPAMLACLHDLRGNRVAAHRVVPGVDDAEAICAAFAIESNGHDDYERLRAHLAETTRQADRVREATGQHDRSGAASLII